MPPPEVTLGGLLAQAGDLSASTLHGPDKSVSLDAVTRSTGIAHREDLRDRCILIVTPDQLTTARTLIELDGIARRFILCPPDLAERHLAGIIRQAGVDAIICGEDRIHLSKFGV